MEGGTVSEKERLGVAEGESSVIGLVLLPPGARLGATLIGRGKVVGMEMLVSMAMPVVRGDVDLCGEEEEEKVAPWGLGVRVVPTGGGVAVAAERSSRPEWLLGVAMPPPVTTGDTLRGAGLDPVAMGTLGDRSSELERPPAAPVLAEVMTCDSCEEGETDTASPPFAMPTEAVAVVAPTEEGVASVERSEVTKVLGASVEGGGGAETLGAFLALMSVYSRKGEQSKGDEL